MKILVVYASKHGATKGIAERITTALRLAGHTAEARPAKDVLVPAGFDAFVIGSAAYFGHWQKEATEFVHHHHELLAGRPVWLFSSGPLGTATVDAKGHDVRDAAEPKEIAELRAAVGARDHRVFFGALDPGTLGACDRLIRALPVGHTLLPEGDFREWTEIDAWAATIASELSREVAVAYPPVPSGSGRS
jgi:menaquinone-dependent protoporphyrinogen oxidase